jgi:hypothetical protein
MAEPEKIIVDAINALGVFDKVRWLIAESDSDAEPTALPLFILSDAGRDFTAAQTFCGSDFSIRNYSAIIIAESAADVRSLFEQCRTALSGIANITGSSDSYDSESGAFTCEISLTY